ncbi:Jag N-terminal domain-containing protein [Iamia majanohamensis]|uniref:RNA-binding protein KhpB n=1 Tax=Iamia majanohamensis TaxID=467976 RepID=A0AAF0BVJ3_9ACTN|nr:RNA-binding cell elongation regulator Jag/EloR [Iamia majanohamensis]WCO67103.1 Jag N-terminal domain-containing protein [Iamia majanohamensis]
MEWVENAASTVEEAKDRVLDDLGIDESDAEIEVLEEPRPGLFGRTKGKARVRARVRPRPQPPKQERRERKRGGKSRGGSGRGAQDGASTNGDRGRSADGDGGRSASGAGRRSGGGGGRSRASESKGGNDDTGSAAPRGGDPVETQTMTLDEQVACVEGFVSGLVDAFGAEARIEVVEIDDETREVQVHGEDLGLLIGPRGATLQAVHELARTVVFRQAPDGQEGRVRIDIGGYRERRREALERFATQVAEQVAASGTPKSLEPMSPPDRKVVHDAINEVAGVVTSSEGEEPRRRVVVSPEG